MSGKPTDITFNRPAIVGRELEFMAAAVDRMHISGEGHFSRLCSALLKRDLGVAAALMTTSCTSALEMAALLLDPEPGDEVIVPAYTFVSSVNAFALRGVKPIFADVRSDTLNIDEAQLPELITDRTRAIVVVHYSGVACEMDTIMSLARDRGVEVIEDNAHGLFATYRGRPLASFGRWSTLSFHETKNLTCGEGGALLLNRPEDLSRAEIIRDKGTNRQELFRGQVDKYTWRDLGSSYVMSDVLAAFLYGQLELWPQIQSLRQRLWEHYDAHLEGWADRRDIRRPTIPPHCEQAYHMYYVLLPSAEARASLMQHLRDRGILAVFHYAPLHLSERGAAYGARLGDCPVAESVSERLLRLPFFNAMTEEQRDLVVASLAEWGGT